MKNNNDLEDRIAEFAKNLKSKGASDEQSTIYYKEAMDYLDGYERKSVTAINKHFLDGLRTYISELSKEVDNILTDKNDTLKNKIIELKTYLWEYRNIDEIFYNMDFNKVLRQFNKIVIEYNKKYNADLSGVQVIIGAISPRKEHLRNDEAIPKYLNNKMLCNGIIWDDWTADITDDLQCTKYICQYGITDGTKWIVEFYFIFTRDNNTNIEDQSEENDIFYFKALTVHLHTESKWFTKIFLPTKLEYITKITKNYDQDVIDILELEEVDEKDAMID